VEAAVGAGSGAGSTAGPLVFLVRFREAGSACATWTLLAC
jgi:hypothetical protein